MSRRVLRVLLSLGCLSLLLLPLTAFAHDEITVGNYVFTIGWRAEPPLAGQLNGPYIFVSTKEAHEAEHHSDETAATPEAGHEDGGDDAHKGAGVEGAEATLTFNVEYGGVNQSYELRPIFGEPGAYTTDFIPTRPGVYTFHLGGSINGEAIELTFDPEEVAAANTLMFPEAAPDAAVLTQQVQAAQSQASTAQTIAIVAAVLGLIGVGVGGFSLMRKK